MIEGQGFFYFNFQADSQNRELKDEHLVFFSGSSSTDALDISDAIAAATRTLITTPDYLILLFPDTQYSGLKSAFEKKGSSLNIAIKRLRKSCTVILTGYNIDGDVENAKKLSGRCKFPRHFVQNLLPQIRHYGTIKIATTETNPVLNPSPPGFLYSKFSKRKSNYFIRAENALVETEFTLFISFCLLPYLKNRPRLTKLALPSTIYIDTMGISSLAYSLASLISTLRSDLYQPRVISFHSYNGMNRETFRYRQDSFCLISASTGGGLSIDWCEKTGAEHREVVTLFSFREESEDFMVMTTLTRPEDFETYNEEDNNAGRKEVKIVGEYFLTQHSPPKTVVLTTSHAPKGMADHIRDFTGSGIFCCNRLVRDRNDTWSISVDLEKLLMHKLFEKWLEHQLKYCAPYSVSSIVYQDDPFSERMAALVYTALSSKLPAILQPINQKDISSNSDNIACAGLIIVAASIGSTGRLIYNLNRELRNVHIGWPRLYLVGSIIGESKAQLGRRISNLTQPPKDSPRYRLEPFLKAAVGPVQRPNSWKKEIVILRSLRRSPGRARFRKRLDFLLATDVGLKDDAFWPSDGSNSGEVFRLRPGFAFADEKLDVNHVSASDIYYVIATILQNARDSKTLNPDISLYSQELQQVVLDPETFKRFDDGIIQAAILRAALESELDYSSSADLSESMGRFLEEVILSEGSDSGEAASEFLMAMCTGKLKLVKSIHSTLLSNLQRRRLPAHLKTLVKFLRSQT